MMTTTPGREGKIPVYLFSIERMNDMTYEEFKEKLDSMTGCEDCPYPEATGFRDDDWPNRADHVVGPCGQQHCWLELEDED